MQGTGHATLKHRLDYFAILLFHKIIHKQVAVEFPSYITLVSQTTLRTSHKDQLSYESSVKPRIIKKHYQRKINLTKLTLKTTIKLVKHIKNHPPKSYLKKHLKRSPLKIRNLKNSIKTLKLRGLMRIYIKLIKTQMTFQNVKYSQIAISVKPTFNGIICLWN